jgi:hypothetical protein
MRETITKLKGGDRRSLGKTNEIVEEVLDHPEIFEELVAGLFEPDPVVRMRSADAMEKVTRVAPELLAPWKGAILQFAPLAADKEVRWHLAQMFSRLKLTSSEREEALATVMLYLEDARSIVKTFSMQALADLSSFDDELLDRAIRIIERLTETGTPAMKSRGRMLLVQLGQKGLRANAG